VPSNGFSAGSEVLASATAFHGWKSAQPHSLWELSGVEVRPPFGVLVSGTVELAGLPEPNQSDPVQLHFGWNEAESATHELNRQRPNLTDLHPGSLWQVCPPQAQSPPFSLNLLQNVRVRPQSCVVRLRFRQADSGLLCYPPAARSRRLWVISTWRGIPISV
jgi:hypothetical protein